MPFASEQDFMEKAAAKKAMCMEKNSTSFSEKQILSDSSFATLSNEQQLQWFNIKLWRRFVAKTVRAIQETKLEPEALCVTWG